MPVLVCCDSCTGKYKVPDQHAGKRIKCPKCSSPVTVPAAPPAAKKTAPITARKPAAETVKETPPPAKRKTVKVPPPPQAPTPESEPEMEPVSQAAEESAEEERPRVEERPKKKKRRKKPKEANNTWMYWAGGVGVGLIAAIIAMIAIANSGHKEQVIAYAVGLAIMVPISTVILIISMFVASALGGGIDFGPAGPAIIKTICLLVAVNLVGMVPFGSILVFPIWLLGLMYLFDLDLWECRFLIFINWFLNWIAKIFLFALILSLIMHGKGGLPGMRHLDDSGFGRSREMTPEERATEEIYKLDGDVEIADDAPGHPVVEVNLAGKAVTDDKLAVLKSFPKLRRLDLSKTPITDAGLTHLKGLTNLALLDLTGTKVTNAGVQELKKSLPNVSVQR